MAVPKVHGFSITMVATLVAIPSRVASQRRGIPNMNEDMPHLIYHMCRRAEWEQALASGAYAGSSQDRADGFIHFSTAAQLPESARRHRSGQAGLVLLAVDPQLLGEHMRWEPSRQGTLFPHLYGILPVSAVRWVRDLPLGADGVPALPSLD
jgi:uncharacterized protein (DUF952 family)